MNEDGPEIPERIEVAVNVETAKALREMMEREGVTLTEAARRLIAYGDVLYRASRIDRAKVTIKNKSGATRTVKLL